MSINALSSSAPLSKPNKYNTFQGQERTEDFDLNWYQYKWRNHDPSIGRFFNVDPLADKYPSWTTYAFSGNMVTNNNELEGLEPAPPYYQIEYLANLGRSKENKLSNEEIIRRAENNTKAHALGVAAGLMVSTFIASPGAFVVEEGIDATVEATTGVPMITGIKDLVQSGARALRKSLTKKVDDVVENTAGTAIVRHGGDDLGHFTVETDFMGSKLHTHQMIDGDATSIALAPMQKLFKEGKIELPNAKAAQQYQESVLGRQFGPYDKKCNSCATHVGDVLRSGGLDISQDALQQYKQLLKIVRKKQ